MANFLHRSSFCVFSVLTKRIRVLKASYQQFFYSPRVHQFTCEKLVHRDLLRLSGKDISSLLQGLITNDMRLFETESTSPHNTCMYSLMLNLQGRIMYDILLYKLSNEELLLECDTSVRDDLIKHLKKYKLRKKVDITYAGNELALWVVFTNLPSSTSERDPSVNSEMELDLKSDKVILAVQDPRLSLLGHRVIIQKDTQVNRVFSDISAFFLNDGESYMQHRYQLGVGEGIKDLPPDNCFPLDSNGDLLHGISFQKGCYLGQELTSRTYHTGVVRKRLMPIIFEEPVPQDMKASAVIINEDGKNLGRYRNHCSRYGLAMLKIVESLNSKKLLIKDTNVNMKVHTPKWWPEEALKEAAH